MERKKAVKQTKRPKKAPKSFLAECKGKLCFAFDFGEYATKIAVARITSNGIDVRNLLTVENDERSCRIDDSNIKEWRTKLSRVFAQNNLNPSGQIGMCTIGCRQYISRQLSVPFAEEPDLNGLVAYEMSQSLSLDIDSYLFQQRILREYEENGVKMCSVWAAAVSKTLCDNYYNLIESLKLKPLVMDININGVERLLAADSYLHKQAEDKTIAVIDYGIRGTEVSVFENGRYAQGFNIELGEGRLVAAAKNVLGIQIADIHNGNKLIVSPQVIYDILRNAQSSEMAKAFMSVVEEWLTEINTVIQRYNINHPAGPVSGLYLYGGSQQLYWLKAYLEKYLNTPADIISKVDYCTFPKKNASGSTIPQVLNVLDLFLFQ